MASNSTRKLWAAHIARGGAKAKGPKQPARVTLGRSFRGRVLGIDPSLRGSGFAVLDYSADGTARILEAATLKLHRSLSMPECLGAIGNQVDDFLNQHSVEHVAVEQTIYVQNFQTAQILGAARGAAIGTAAMRGLPVFEYAPLRVKQAVVGMGRASKEQVARTVQNITGTNFELRFDESDAAAVALCHAFTWREQ
ncbi:crossover junction endodeoxyribonuclease RuvC [Coraliomargarita sp. SDUM461003]|uniref:Crossover junction endodeoxyribonuclease RuvC n=1 Tax=Thalassobacterium maritimum TaxID=3041265 RepID=A0ABU1AXZ4_9BACT|nr:crossover junction endodeoxyribonuclease RuvC [Coraliomargarita sp. SDUM461003]MBT64286.1 crossover junction endodeoxyribonuclease RuvC [Puniceicoccaceae bacterium]MDQ8208956.1 crossover junction endodeoxyribonuclease RuvC [Coraliomargarita sp. SDUM461003]HBR93599.1 crossover junction endodeoxyribonuclease RuvC [Opitutae bacterium]|tara:strand:+ start:14189 stop:14776 length:588 start_codon:yes stop_codon:yes gene_type:complete